ncbi:SDR family oxidoreductase [Sphingopyxis sp.]|uniref:SDR family oxidoreductase n=1 Tax=Sphingopyxis sp. TaxID=1908224 RepID=UPI002D7A225D|nr:SDR family oxidoreductase [Sphingopyxis sp.]HET6523120.1 SDR family oxidoreductase [Sphingopyxis sp.]
MDLKLKGKTAIVTGASQGIGLATVRSLIAEGVQVVGAARNIRPELKETGAVGLSIDLSEPDSGDRLVEAAIKEFGGVDLLVNNVAGGENITLDGFLGIDDTIMVEMMNIILFAAVRVTRAALPSLIERGGAIVNVGSLTTWQPADSPMPYSIPKAALKSFSKALATEFGPKGVRVNMVSPGPVRTGVWESDHHVGAKMAAASGMTKEELIATLPEMSGMLLGKITEPEEVAALITFLLSDVARSVIGSDHLIDGGICKSA